MGFEVAGQIRLAKMVDDFWDRRERKKLEEQLEIIHSTLEDGYHFEYLVKNDRVGYLRALSKTKEVFRGLIKDDPYDGMIVPIGKKGDWKINPDFMATLEDFYYGEIRKEANIVDLKLHRYNTIRDKNLAICIKNPKFFPEGYAQNVFNTTREEMFEMVKRNEALFVLCNGDNLWNIIQKSRYVKNVKLKTIQEHFPVELCT